MPAEMNIVRLGDSGFVLEFTVYEDGAVVDISAATGIKVWLKPPKGPRIEKSGVLISGGTTGKFGYTFTATDLPISDYGRQHYVGLWKAQGNFVLGSWSGSADEVQFTVQDVLRDA